MLTINEYNNSFQGIFEQLGTMFDQLVWLYTTQESQDIEKCQKFNTKIDKIPVRKVWTV